MLERSIGTAFKFQEKIFVSIFGWFISLRKIIGEQVDDYGDHLRIY